jgi:glycosyltransferase involved in cell wall biosynthesis
MKKNTTYSEEKKLKILQIAPIYIPIKPDLKYGGIERVVLALGKSFNAKGHTAITAAPADSNPYGQLLPTLSQSEWTKPKIEGEDPLAYEKHVQIILDYLLNEEVDVVHDHTGNFVLTKLFNEHSEKHDKLKQIPFIVTPHELRRFAKIPSPNQKNILFTSLSEYQKGVFSDYVNVQEVINNGVEIDAYPYQKEKENFLFSIGSIEKDKGQDLAVKVSLETGIPLKVAGNIAEKDFYDLEIKRHSPQIEYVGELNDQEKKEFYKKAKASILPIRIGDCFTLTRIESLACGTPVITLDTGSAKEAIDHEATGYVIPHYEEDEDKTVEFMSDAARNIDKISNSYCREVAEQRFTWDKVTDKYIQLYKGFIDKLRVA